MTKYRKSNGLGKAGSFAFSQKEAKDIRKNFIPVTNLDHLALYIDGTKFSPESFDRFFDSNLRKKGSQAFNLRWIKNGGAKVDQLALSIQNDVQGYNTKDESEIIEDIQYLITSYPAGFTEYYFEASQKNEQEENDNANYSDMENEIEREQANEAFEAGLKKALKPKTKIKKVVKTVTKTVTKRKTVNKTKQAYTPEFLAIKSLYNLNGKNITTKQLELVLSKVTNLVKRGNKNNHFQLLKTIKGRLELAIFKLDGNKITKIKKFEIQKDLLEKLTAVVLAPKVKQVTLGGLKNHQKQYNKEVDAYKWFIVDLDKKKALAGYEFRSDAFDVIPEYENCKIVAKSSLKKLGIADPSESWKHKDTTKKKSSLGSLFSDALHGIEQYTDADMKELGINYSNSLNGVGKGKKSPYDIINEKLIAILKGGNIPWINQRTNAPIKGEDGTVRNYITKRPYNGVNVIMLNSFMEPHHNSFFLTKKQIEAKGGNLNKGAKGFQVIFTKKLTVTNTKPAIENKPATEETKQVFMLNTYIVYNSADTDLKLRLESTPKTEKQVIESCETIYPNMPKKPVLKFGGQDAFYVPAKDYVQIPNQNNFTTVQGYYRTLFHELAHSTGHKSRLNRKGEVWSVNKRDYAIEELVAEIASSYICGYTGIYFANEQKHASYLNHYLKELHGSKLEQYKADLVLQAQTDKTFLLHAIGAAQKAANFILSKQLQSLKKAKKPNKTDKTKLNGLGNAQNEVAEAIRQKQAASRQKSPFQTMDKLVSGGTYQLAGERGKLLGNLGQVDCSITIRGDQGAGKSQLMWQLVNDFASIGKRVAVVSPEMNGSSPTISKYRDKYITPENSSKILFTDKKLSVKEIKDLNASYDVVFVDSFNQLANYEQKQFEWLCKELPTKCIIGLFQSTTGGEMRGGNSPEFDAYVNIEVVKVDDTFINNYAVCTKNRFGGTGLKYNISTQKIMKPGSTALNGVARSKTTKKVTKTAKKITKGVKK